MHERALLDDVMRKLNDVAAESNASRITRVTVRFGPLSHFTPEHFREHFVDASRGTIAEGAEVDAELDTTLTGERAVAVLLEDVEVEIDEQPVQS